MILLFSLILSYVSRDSINSYSPTHTPTGLISTFDILFQDSFIILSKLDFKK